MPPEQPRRRSIERTVHYTMKTSRPPTTPSQGSSTIVAHAGPSPQSFFSNKPSTTPTAPSPHFPYSVGQPYPPKLSSPAATTTASVHRLATPQHINDVSAARTPSPNYFGLVVEPTPDPRDSAMLPRENWSPATSSVRSFAAAIPKQLPLDANPEFEAFRRQADANRGKSGFNLSTSHFGLNSGPWPVIAGAGGASSPAPVRPRPPRWHTHGSDMSMDTPAVARPVGLAATGPLSVVQQQQAPGPAGARGGLLGVRQPSANRMDIDVDSNSLHDSAYVSADSKRNSEASLNLPSFLNMPRHESPAQFESPFDKRTSLSTVEDRHPRLSVTHGRPDPPGPATGSGKARADTLPAAGAEAGGPAFITPTELKDLLQSPAGSSLLLLDIRAARYYFDSRIQGALNLCIPTTLLKRATYNLQKLQQTFQSEHDQDKFATWSQTTHLVVYDAHPAEKRDAIPCVNMLKKFTNEGYAGKVCILRGGFDAFSEAYPQLLDRRLETERAGPPAASSNGTGGDSIKPSLAPVIGGFMLPQGSNAAPNPFFSNIRQNTELVDGVGQMDVAVPPDLDQSALPAWLSRVLDEADHGKQVSDKFLGIEKKELARMNRAYAPASTAAQQQLGTGSAPTPVQLSGIEKGAKNRYNNILPFEHARVRLGGKLEGECDYINASHITTSRSHKRYIASQGPLPDTFEDFWTMIWDQDVRVIVMLTAESEGGQLKCHPYWRGKEFGPIKLRALSEKKVSLDIDKHRSSLTVPNSPSNSRQTGWPNANPSTPGPQNTQPQMSSSEGRRRANTTANPLRQDISGVGGEHLPQTQPHQQSPGEIPYVIVRKFALSHTSRPFAPIREITHLHYSSWPDFGTPAQPSHLLALVELANVMQRAALPLNVHSAMAASSEREKASKLSPQNSSNGRDFVHEVWQDEPVEDARARPMLVHCSAGCGRTGTFCTVDSVVDMLKRQRQRAMQRAEANAASMKARAERATRRRELGVKRKLEQRDSEGDIPMLSALGSGGRAVQRREDDSISPVATSFQAASDATMAGFHFSSPPPRFPSLPSASSSGAFREARSSTTSGSGSDEGTTPPYYSSSSDEHSPTATEAARKTMSSPGGLDTSWMDDETFDLIASTVEDFRGQRLSMVQSIRQFVLCYETVLEWVARLQERTGDGGAAAAFGGMSALTGGADGAVRSPRSRLRNGSPAR